MNICRDICRFITHVGLPLTMAAKFFFGQPDLSYDSLKLWLTVICLMIATNAMLNLHLDNIKKDR